MHTMQLGHATCTAHVTCSAHVLAEYTTLQHTGLRPGFPRFVRQALVALCGRVGAVHKAQPRHREALLKAGQLPGDVKHFLESIYDVAFSTDSEAEGDTDSEAEADLA